MIFQAHHTRGALLIEILVAISVFAILAAVTSQSFVVGTQGSVKAANKEIGYRLMEEMMESVRSTAEGRWHALYDLTKASEHYHLTRSGGAWQVVQGDEVVVMNGITYTRYFTISDVSRDPTTRDIEMSYLGAHDDASTQLVTATVVWSGDIPVSVNEYLFRWRNQICTQTSWSGVDSGVKGCPDTTYVDQTDISTGASLELCAGDC